ncbi:MAG: hypothetical protein GX640_23295, partial [Fibrobacter sp.]|nr:hypothetical protein [Fibrobacter sp.]
SYPEEYYYWAEPVIKIVNIILGIISIFAVASIVLQYGFYLSEKHIAIISRINLIIVQFYFLQFLLKIIFSRNKLSFLRHRWFEAALAVLILFEIAVIIRVVGINLISKYFLDINVTAITEIYIGVAQALIILSIITEGIRYNRKIASLKFHPSQTLIISFVIVIIIGTGLLMLPKATHPGTPINLINALFTATSATCVTGFTIVDTGTYFTHTGQIFILILSQIGGLGTMTLSSFLALFFGQGVGIKERVVLHQMMNIDKIGMINTMLRNAVLITLGVEAAGALSLMFFWSDRSWTLQQLVYRSVYHSVSAFCNAGFSLFPDSLVAYANSVGIIFTISALIIIGGLGFTVICDLFEAQKQIRKKQRYRLKIQTKLVLIITSFLLVAGFVCFYFLDTKNSGWSRILLAFFNSVTCRSAGFNTIDLNLLTNTSLLIMMILMFIGASPGSTGGGIKTTTVGVLWASIVAIITGQNRIVIFKRRLPFLVLNRALVIFAFSVIVIGISVIFLSISENAPVFDIMFEAVSAYATAGLSRGLTSNLSITGKLIIIFLMFIGRLGALTLAFAI